MNTIRTFIQRWRLRRANRPANGNQENQQLFPLEVKDYWYCGDFYDYQFERHKAGLSVKAADMDLPCERFLICQYRDYKGPGSYPKEVGQVIACQKLEGKIAYYEVTAIRKGSWVSDCLDWDDNTRVDLRLHHIESVKDDGQGGC